jgi:hypothetical protein
LGSLSGKQKCQLSHMVLPFNLELRVRRDQRRNAACDFRI